MRNSHNLNFVRQLGFTIIEMVVVLAIIMLLGTASFAGFNTYNATAQLNSAADNLRNTLNEAKSIAMSQTVITSACLATGETMVGGQVYIPDTSSYRIKEVCVDSSGVRTNSIIRTITLPAGVTFKTTGTLITFLIQSQGGGTELSADTTIELDAGSSKRYITVTQEGLIK